MKRVLILIAALILIESIVYSALDYSKSMRINEYYESKVVIYRNNFLASVSSYEQIFDTIYADKLDVNEVKSLIHGALHDQRNRDSYRNWLRIYTQPIYDSLKSVGLVHMHYHLPDGTSFLRMHRPLFYGDSLDGFRATVAKVNSQHVKVQGFENGRHLLAYRFIYPLSYEGEHIGSVELSVGLKQFINGLNRLYGIGYSYLLEKDKIFTNYTGKTMDEYEGLSISENYYMDSCTACSYETDNTCIDDKKLKKVLIDSVTVRNAEKIKNYEDFAEIVDIDGDVLLTYLSVKDVNGVGMGYIISHDHVKDYGSIIIFYRMLFLVISFITLSIVSIFFALDYSRRRAQQMNTVLERKVKEKVRELQEKEQFFAQQSKMVTMGEMLASILHQWKQPLSSITLIADLLLFECEQKNGDPEMHENIKNIKEQAHFMSQTGNDFRNFMKPSKEKTVFNITEAVEEVIRLFEFSFTRYNTGFEKEWSEETGRLANVSGYPNEFKHVLLNFFNNSRDAIVQLREKLVERGEDVSDFKGVITISIEIAGDTVVVRVADTGGGIPEEIMSRVFEKYFSTKDEQGSGIGLHMTSEMVQKSMNGHISVKNIVGGAEFTLVFPIAK